MADSHPADAFRAANQHLRALWSRIRHNQENATSLDEISEVFAELVPALDLLHNLWVEVRKHENLESEMSSFRWTLEQLQAELPGLRGRLFAERARLDAENAQRMSATAWAEARKAIL